MLVRGIVIGSDGDPIPGAVIFLSDATGKPVKNISGITNKDGGFAMTLSGSDESLFLTATYVGTKNQTLRPSPVTNFKLPDNGDLPEVVVTATKLPIKAPIKKTIQNPVPETKKDYTNFYIALGILGFLVMASIIKSQKSN